MKDITWRLDPPDSPGIWWYRPADDDESDFTPVEYISTVEGPILIYHISLTYRRLDSPHFTGREWYGPVARRQRGGAWALSDFSPAAD